MTEVEDQRPRVTTTKAINPKQLEVELGVAICWTGDDSVLVTGGVEATVTVASGAVVTQAELENAIAAHAAAPIAEQTAEQKLSALGITKSELIALLA